MSLFILLIDTSPLLNVTGKYIFPSMNFSFHCHVFISMSSIWFYFQVLPDHFFRNSCTFSLRTLKNIFNPLNSFFIVFNSRFIVFKVLVLSPVLFADSFS